MKKLLIDDVVSIVPYDDSHEGLIQSWIERFSKEEYKAVDEALVIKSMLRLTTSHPPTHTRINIHF